jgi:hypothetical protein
MVRHRTVSRADHAVKFHPHGEEVAVKRKVRRLGENLRPAVAALGPERCSVDDGAIYFARLPHEDATQKPERSSDCACPEGAALDYNH